MTEISTNNLNPVDKKESSMEDLDYPDDLDANDQRFYKAIASKLTLMQTSPKEETVIKIIRYSRLQK